MRPSGDEHQLADPGVDQRLDRVRDHRPVVQRQQMLVRYPGQRVKPRAGAAGEDDVLHAAATSWLLGSLAAKKFGALAFSTVDSA